MENNFSKWGERGGEGAFQSKSGLLILVDPMPVGSKSSRPTKMLVRPGTSQVMADSFQLDQHNIVLGESVESAESNLLIRKCNPFLFKNLSNFPHFIPFPSLLEHSSPSISLPNLSNLHFFLSKIPSNFKSLHLSFLFSLCIFS